MSEATEFPVPPADFSFLVQSILMQTQMQLGLLHFGEEDEAVEEPNLPLARHSIDLLSMLQVKTKGNLTGEEQRLLENGLTELRFRYVQVADEQKKKAEPQLSGPSEDEGPRIITSDGGKGTKTS
jgi:hypothetical protein